MAATTQPDTPPGAPRGSTTGLVGAQLGRYVLESEIGQGGMSVVYRARDLTLERTVAVKVMHGFLAAQSDARERFRREAMAVARLDHPHIIDIYDYSGPDAEISYIVTELVEGTPLSSLMQPHPMACPEAMLIVAEPIAAALQHAHEHGIVHRDLKPENILVGRDGCLKLTDFGIARMLDNQTLTVSGTLLGSPAYMAPEYIEGQETDPRGDVFSLGAMLYQLTVGAMPFEAASPHALLKKIATGDCTPPEQRNPAIHGSLAALIRRCMAHSPADRYGSAGELLADLQAISGRLGLDTAAERPAMLASPYDYSNQLGERLLPMYVELGRKAMRAGDTGAAMRDFDRVLCIDPDHHEVRRLLGRISHRRLAGRALGLLALSGAGAAVVTVVAGWLTSAQAPSPAEPSAPQPAASLSDSSTLPAEIQRDVPIIVEGEGDVYVGDRLLAANVSGPLAERLPVGNYEFRLVTERGTVRAALFVPPDGRVPLVQLTAPAPDTAAPSPAPNLAPVRRDVTFMLVGSYASIELDGEVVRENASNKVVLPMTGGRHRLRFLNPYFEAEPVELNVTATEPAERVVVRLQPRPASLFVRGAPNEAVVEVGDQARIVSPETRDLPISVDMDGKSLQVVEVVVKKSGFQNHRQRVELRPGQEREISVSLSPTP